MNTTQTQKIEINTQADVEALSAEYKMKQCFESLKAKIAAIEERGFNGSDVPELVGYAQAVEQYYEEI